MPPLGRSHEHHLGLNKTRGQRGLKRVRCCCNITLLLGLVGSLVRMESRIRCRRFDGSSRKSLLCQSSIEATDGLWVERPEKPAATYWQPHSCLLKFFDEESTRRVTNFSRITLIGGQHAKAIRDVLCDNLSKSKNAWCENRIVYVPSHQAYKTFENFLHQQQTEKVFTLLDQDEHLCSMTAMQNKGDVHSSMHSQQRDLRKCVEVLCQSLSSKRNNVELTILHRMPSTLTQAAASSCLFNVLDVSKVFQIYAAQHSKPDPKLVHTLKNIILTAVENENPEPLNGVFDSIGTCALVSTAGYLSNFQHGNAIDKADHVIRVGVGKRIGFEHHVGSRTDLRILRESVFSRLSSGKPPFEPEDQILVMYDSIKNGIAPLRARQHGYLVHALHHAYVNFEVQRNKTRLQVTDFGRCLNLDRDLSSGIWAFILLYQELRLCSSIQLFGFLGTKHVDQPYHYSHLGTAEGELKPSYLVYDSRKRTKSGHDFELEQECLIKFAASASVETDSLYYELPNYY